MKFKNIKSEIPYWDEGNKNDFPWFKKGKWKRILRKRNIKKQIKNYGK
jgi:hypothetical protein